MGLDDRNYYNDRRVIAGERTRWWKALDERRMRATVEIYYEDEAEGCDVEEEREVPFTFAVCPTCSGKGTHVNPSIDASGITADDWAEWDQDDREAYQTGGYDVPCFECNGQRVVPELDRDRTDPFVLGCLDRAAESADESRAIERAERAMGA